MSKPAGVWIPKELWESRKTTPSMIFVFVLIDQSGESNGTGFCWMTNKEIGKRLRIHPNHISSTISRLKNLGFLVDSGTVTIENAKHRVLRSFWNFPDGSLVNLERKIRSVITKDGDGVSDVNLTKKGKVK